MKILLITDLYPINGSNDPITVKQFALEWKKAGHDIEVIRPNFIPNALLRKKKLFAEKTYEEDGIKIHNINCLTPFLFDVSNKLPKNFEIGSYNLIISHMPTGALFAMKTAAKCVGIPYVCSVHASDITVLTKPQYKLYFASELRRAYKRADAISARSKVLENKIQGLSPYAAGKTFVADSGIDAEIIEPIEYFEEKAMSDSRPYIISVTASLIKRKNVDIVIKALAKAQLDNYVLRIMGDGPEKQNLQNLVKELNIEEKVIFEGHIPNKEVLIQLRKSDLFILVSTGETFGLSYLEAASRANIVVSAENDGIDGIIENGVNGFVCKPDETKLAELIDKISELSKEDRKNIIFNMRDTLIKNDKETVSKRYLDKILQLTNQ